jgi:ATP-binding cassette subfamily B multidrug efflux pump
MSPASAIFPWLETATDPFPPENPVKPPADFIGFVFHHTRPFWPLLPASSILATLVAWIEVSLFAFVGMIVD